MQVVQKAAGTGDQDVDAALETVDLRIDADPAVGRGATQPGLAAQHAEGVVDLLGQFAGGGHDQGAQGSAFALDQAVQDRQGKRGRLAGAGLGQAHDVAAFEDRRHGLDLDGGRGRVACGTDACGDLGVKVEGVKIFQKINPLVVAILIKANSNFMRRLQIKKAPDSFRSFTMMSFVFQEQRLKMMHNTPAAGRCQSNISKSNSNRYRDRNRN